MAGLKNNLQLKTDLINKINHLTFLNKEQWKYTNFNYLTNTLIKEIMFALLEKHDLSVLDGEDEYDDTLPYRNLIKDPYTRIMLPTYKHSTGADKHLSYSEAKTMMERLYNQKLRRFVNKRDIYRTYKTEKMSAPSAILFDFKNLR